MGLGDGGHGGEERVVGKGVVDGRHVPSEEEVGGVATGIVVHSAHVRMRVCVGGVDSQNLTQPSHSTSPLMKAYYSHWILSRTSCLESSSGNNWLILC